MMNDFNCCACNFGSPLRAAWDPGSPSVYKYEAGVKQGRFLIEKIYTINRVDRANRYLSRVFTMTTEWRSKRPQNVNSRIKNDGPYFPL